MKKILIVLVYSAFILSCGNAEHQPAASPAVSELPSPASDSSSLPCLATDPKGNVFLSWVEKTNGMTTLKFSILKNDEWSLPINIDSGRNWFVNWADYPSIASDGNGNILAHFLEKSDTSKYTYDVKTVLSSDNGNSWSARSLLHDDAQKAEHGFVSLIPYRDGFFASWLDGRNSPAEKDQGHSGHHGSMTVRAALLDRSGKKQQEWELDSRVCDCCQTTAAITSDGPVVVYRDRSEDEIRDMSIVRLVNGQWTTPQTIYPDNWKIRGCPVNGPRIDALKNNLVVAWYTAPDSAAHVNVLFSSDGGQHFGDLIQVNEGKAIGRVDVSLLDEKRAIITWMEGSNIKSAIVHADGQKESSFVVAASSEARASGFPQLARSGNKLIYAWTDTEKKTVKTAMFIL